MPKIEAWQCPHTGKLFACRNEYLSHLNRLRRRRADERAHAKMLREFKERCDAIRMGCFSHADLEAALVDNIPLFATRLVPYRLKKGEPPPEITELHFQDLRFGIQWNTHGAPLGKRTNWGGYESKHGVPRGFMGWSGSLFFKVSDYMKWDSDAWKPIGIRTGSGGSGGRGTWSRYDVIIWGDDFPNIVFGMMMRGELSAKQVNLVRDEERKLLAEAMEAKAIEDAKPKPPPVEMERLTKRRRRII